jgi:hypothetical protein
MLTRSAIKCHRRPGLVPASLPPPLCVRAAPQCYSSTSASKDQTTTSHNNPEPAAPPTPTTATNSNTALPPLPPNAPTTLHNSLPTFLAHARRTSLSPTSTTYIGTYYEYAVLHTLRRFGFNLTRNGGRGDAGIDLLGTWHLPPQFSSGGSPTGRGSGPGPLRVLVQCKALKAKLGPNLIRELEGAFVGAPAGYRASPAGGVVGVLVSPREATKGVRDAMARSRWPMVWVMLEVRQRVQQVQKHSGDEGAGGDPAPVEVTGSAVGRAKQMLWNKAAGSAGLEGLDVTIRYDQAVEGEDGLGRECVLMWQGTPVPGLDEQEAVKS